MANRILFDQSCYFCQNSHQPTYIYRNIDSRRNQRLISPWEQICQISFQNSDMALSSHKKRNPKDDSDDDQSSEISPRNGRKFSRSSQSSFADEKPKKKIKLMSLSKKKFQQDINSDKFEGKHKKHKKERQKGEREELKNEKHKKHEKGSKRRKSKKLKKAKQKLLLEQLQLALSGSDLEMPKKKKKHHHKQKHLKRLLGDKNELSKKRPSKKNAIVSASEDEGRPIELQSDSSELNEQPDLKSSKRKRRKAKSETGSNPAAGNFSIDEVIDLDNDSGPLQSGSRRGKAPNALSRLSKHRLERLTKIKQPVIKNIIVTKNVENVPVDHHFSKFNECRVLELGGCFYNATLTQSNIVRDDNKFFIIQILEMNYNPDEHYVYSRWGRVGVTGQISELGPLNRQAAIRHYNQVVQNKIKIGRYKVVEMNYDDYVGPKAKEKGNKQFEIPSKLEPRVQELIRLIFDSRMMNSHMKEIGYDEKRMPLGKLAESSIKEGYDTLNGLMAVINDRALEQFERKRAVNELSAKFYQCIPHDFGYMNMQTFVLDTAEKVKEKLEVLTSLQEIQIYNRILSDKFVDPELNELDQKYYRLAVKIQPLRKGSDTFRQLIKYVQNTHAKTHNKYDLEVEEIYQLSKEEDELGYRGEVGNKTLLWHGSRLTNYVGILSKGLRIAPLEAPSTGYMFGKGVYFTDMVSKSANYCLATKVNDVGLVLLCEVALGKFNQKFQADFQAADLPPGYHSTKGMGRTEPMGGEWLEENVWIPNGKAAQSGVGDQTSLLYNEYVVYDPTQIKYRYLFRLKFNFKVTETVIPGLKITS